MVIALNLLLYFSCIFIIHGKVVIGRFYVKLPRVREEEEIAVPLTVYCRCLCLEWFLIAQIPNDFLKCWMFCCIFMLYVKQYCSDIISIVDVYRTWCFFLYCTILLLQVLMFSVHCLTAVDWLDFHCLIVNDSYVITIVNYFSALWICAKSI